MQNGYMIINLFCSILTYLDLISWLEFIECILKLQLICILYPSRALISIALNVNQTPIKSTVTTGIPIQ